MDQHEKAPAQDSETPLAEGVARLPPAVSPYLAGLTASCPACGKGKLFRGGLTLRDTCAVCGQSFAAADPGDGPAVFAIFILGFVILGGALMLEFRVGPPWWVHVLLWGIVTPVFAFFLLRVLKATLIALQFKHKAQEARLTLTS
jgi:uncharacterized protein (DUF983 family)